MSTVVSIVIPVYNHDRYVAAAIESVLDQTWRDLELVVVDDGSTDGSRQIIERYANRCTTMRHENMGQAMTLNKAWDRTHGTVLGYLSADDTLEPSAVSRAIELLESKPDVVATYSDYNLVSPESEIIRRVHTPWFELSDVVTGFVLPPGPGAFFRREALRKTGGWNPRYRQMPDYDFWIRIGRLGRVERIPECLASFRVHEGSTSFAAADESRSDEPIRILEEYFADDPPQALLREKNKALARAHVVSARAHLRAGRYKVAADRLRAGRLHDPGVLVSGYALKLLLSGLFGRLRSTFEWQLARLRSNKAR